MWDFYTYESYEGSTHANLVFEKEYGIEYRTPSNWWCNDIDKGNHMGNLAYSLGTFLENTGSTRLREIIGKINWLEVRSLIHNTPGMTANDMSRAGSTVLDMCRAAGVTV